MSELPNNCKRLREQLKKSLECEEAIEKELDEARVQVAVLRGVLESLIEGAKYTNKHVQSETVAEDIVAAENALSATPSKAAERVSGLVVALKKLARLGGPDGGYGNSDGNVIAQRALAAWREKCE